jgi:hypothetical protein
MTPQPWPASREFVEVIQNPSLCFADPELRASIPAVDKLGLPLVASGQFAYVFKLNSMNGNGAQAVRCFRSFIRDREQRYEAIDNHLDTVSVPALARFEYDSDGILVGGRRWPIIVMEWVDGLPLDVYIGDVINRADVLGHLAESWIEVHTSLRKAGIAHGDLQHGNILVQNGMVRLVDLDGMFVPAMAGWKACENGHQHYQHPRRSEDDFGPALDNFSALVIYLSLLALREQPELWRDHHDENLIFTKNDFVAPANSILFRKLGRLGKQPQSLAEVLSKACASPPLACPSVLDLVAPPSKLPAWMRSGPHVVVKTTTREVKPASSAPPPVLPQFKKETVGPLPPAWQAPSSTMPPAPSSSSGTAPAPPVAPPSQVVHTPQPLPNFWSREAFSQGLTYAVAGLFGVWLWFPVLSAVFASNGAASQEAAWLAILTYCGTCHTLGYIVLRKKAASPPPAQQPIPVVTVPPSPQPRQPVPVITVPSSQAPRPPYQPAPRPVGASTVAYIGNSISRVYHEPGCRWATRIRVRNRVSLSSAQQALSRGYAPCRVCRP